MSLRSSYIEDRPKVYDLSADNFTLMCFMDWPLIESEAGEEQVLINLSAFHLLMMLFLC